MKFPQLQINQSIGRIGARWQKGSFDIENSPAKVDLDYGNPKPFQILAQPKIDNPPAKLSIDKSEFLADVEFRKFNSLAKHLKNLAKKKTLQGISEIAREGNQLAKIENKGDKVVQLAKKGLTKGKKKKLKVITTSPPKVEVKSKPVSVEVRPAKIRVKSDFSFPKIQASGAKVDIYLEQKGKLEIEVDNNNIDYHI